MRLTQFRVEQYRSVKKTDWIDVSKITAFVGQNEAGKSNLCEALYRINPYVADSYILDEDWPVDDWGSKDPDGLVCEARFEITDAPEIVTLIESFGLLWTPPAVPAASGTDQADPAVAVPPGPAPGQFTKDALPSKILLRASKFYNNTRKFGIEGYETLPLDQKRAEAWAVAHLPKCVFIRDYEFPASRTELNDLAQRRSQKKWPELSSADQTILTVLDLAKVNIDDFVLKGATAEGRTLRSFDKRLASGYLSGQFSKLWNQKKVRFDIDIDATTLNILVEDEGVNMPVRLDKRSTGFRWYVAFAWKFTHASRGHYKNCILILEEPGIHLHYDGHRDLLKVFEDLSDTNTLLYTTHVATMLDPGYPERVRIVEIENHHTRVVQGVVSSQRIPMMVIETRLGLSAGMGGVLGNRQTLVVEGGDDALILQKLSGVLLKSNKQGLSDRIYLWPAQGAPKTPMYAGFLVGNKFDAGVLLDSDDEGAKAKTKIEELYLKDLAGNQKFRVLMLKDAAGVKKNEAAIEDLFPDEFYLECVNSAYRTAIKIEDLPSDGSDQITKRIEATLVARHGRSELDKRLVMAEMLRRFDNWNVITDLPKGTAERAEKLFQKINAAFA